MNFFTALTIALNIAFIVLKLTDAIAWSWWLVLSPLLIGILFIVFFTLITPRGNPYA